MYIHVTISGLRVQAGRNFVFSLIFMVFLSFSLKDRYFISIGCMYLKAGLNCMAILTLFLKYEFQQHSH